jgi:hypothetical protein
MVKPTLAIFTVPFQGHFDILHRAASQVWKDQWNIVFIICGWSNFDFPKCDDGSLDYHFLQTHSPLDESCPTQFNFKRAIELRHPVEHFIESQLKSVIDFIVYDFFAVEGFLVGTKMRIPHICSIPAIPSQFNPEHTFYKSKLDEAMPLIRQINLDWFGIKDDVSSPSNYEKNYSNTIGGHSIQMVSDGFLIQGQKQFLWGIENLSRGHYEWMDNPVWVSIETQSSIVAPSNPLQIEIEEEKKDIHVCFGTVVTGNVWQQNPSVQPFLVQLYREIIINLTKPDLIDTFNRLVVVIPWRLEEIRSLIGAEYDNPKIQWESYVNQKEYLSRSKLLITRGGGNTTREAILSKTPMLVVPFFGDQHTTAKCVALHNIGLSMQSDDPGNAVSTHHQFHQRRSASKLWFLLQSLLQNNDRYVSNIQIMLDAKSRWKDARYILDIDNEGLMGIDWREGDLLFGTNRDRLYTSEVLSRDGRPDRFRVFNYDPFSKFGDPDAGYMPRLIDSYHDCIFAKDEYVLKDELSIWGDTKYGESLRAYYNFLGNRKMLNIPNGDDPSSSSERQAHLVNCCVIGLEFFLVHGHTIHFVVDTFDVSVNTATHMEIKMVRELWNYHSSKIHFYSLTPYLHRVDPVAEVWFGADSPPPPITDVQKESTLHLTWPEIDRAQKKIAPLSNIVQTVAESFSCGFLIQSRVKTLESCLEKITQRRKDLNDVLGIRLSQPWTRNNFKLAKRLCADENMNIWYRKVSERGKVIHLYGIFENQKYEIQLWPSILLACFQSEHDTIYKPSTIPTAKMIEASRLMREGQHALQDVVDQNLLVEGGD